MTKVRLLKRKTHNPNAVRMYRKPVHTPAIKQYRRATRPHFGVLEKVFRKIESSFAGPLSERIDQRRRSEDVQSLLPPSRHPIYPVGLESRRIHYFRISRAVFIKITQNIRLRVKVKFIIKIQKITDITIPIIIQNIESNSKLFSNKYADV